MAPHVDVIYTPEIFTIQAVGGISRYFVELIRGLRALGQSPRVAAGLHVNEHLRGLPGVVGTYTRFATVRGARWRRTFNQTLCRLLLNRNRDALTHLTYFGDTEYLRARPLVLTVYDMIHELFQDRFPELHNQADPSLHYKRRNCERAEHIIAISETTKQDLVRIYGINPMKVTVITLGNSLPDIDDPLIGSEPPSPDERAGAYLLHVGTRGGYKNFSALLQAFCRSPRLRQEFRLVCFGGGAFSESEQRLIAATSAEDRVVHRHGSDQALTRFYRGASAFVCPSLYEGFGLPVLEAMSQNCPVICSRAGSLTEVADEAAVYFDPEDPESIRTTLEAAMDDAAHLSLQRDRGRQRASLFSWTRCSRETLEVYRQLSA